MTFTEIKNLVGVANVTIGSALRYSELLSLVNKARAMENGVLTIIVESGTLTYGEINSLASAGGRFVSIDLTKL